MWQAFWRNTWAGNSWHLFFVLPLFWGSKLYLMMHILGWTFLFEKKRFSTWICKVKLFSKESFHPFDLKSIELLMIHVFWTWMLINFPSFHRPIKRDLWFWTSKKIVFFSVNFSKFLSLLYSLQVVHLMKYFIVRRGHPCNLEMIGWNIGGWDRTTSNCVIQIAGLLINQQNTRWS